MKKCLIVLVVINVIAGAVSGFALLAENLLLGIVGFAGTALGIVPYIALIHALEEIEDLRASVQLLFGRTRRMETAMDTSEELSVAMRSQPAGEMWSCPRCQTVNKVGTASCESCGAAYTIR